MFAIEAARWLAPDIREIVVQAPRVARKARAGQFVIVRVHEHGERIPLTLAAWDRERGSVTLVVQGVGKTTKLMNTLEAGDALLDLAGPLGRPTELERYGEVVVLGGGVGTAIAWPAARALREAGNRVHFVLAARTAELVILEDAVRADVDELSIVTDDGSRGERGLVTAPLQRRLEGGAPPDAVFAVGPVPMMRAVAELTRPHRIKTITSLNAIMVDGTGMCGGCRVLVGGRSQFACVDGPEFDAHEVDFDVLTRRNRMYVQAERESLERYLADLKGDAGSTCAAESARGSAAEATACEVSR